ncbi:LysE family translocator [Caenispirillum salinarum]|uniref:LysE family translocator n=1 Tax=Caenispirillum salinarum TaxID=859058 RepID=UPI00384F8E12
MNSYVGTLMAMAAFALATSASPGPVNIISAMTGARFGVLRSFRYVLGATVAFVAILLLMGAGLGTVIVENEAVAKGLAVAGAAYILYLAWKVARADHVALDDGGRATLPPGFLNGAVAQASNPKAWIVSLSAVSVYVAGAPDYAATLAVFGAVFFVVCLGSLWGWAAVGRWLSALSGSVAVFNRVMAALLALSVLWFMATFVFG